MRGRLRIDQYNQGVQNQIAAQLYPKKKDCEFVASIKIINAYPDAENNAPVASRLPAKKPEPDQRRGVLANQEAEHGSAGRTCLVITRCSTGRLDRDNLWASTKALVDALRYAGQITGDTEEDVELFVFQAKVPRKDTGTLVEIVRL